MSNASSHSQIAIQARWTVDAWAPLRISSPEKFLHFTRNFLGRDDKFNLLHHATLHLVSWKRIASKLRLLYPLGHRECEALLSGGEHLWTDANFNRIVNTGLDDILDKYFKGSTYTAAHYVGLTDGTPTTAAGDTMASHAGWAEVTAYSEGTRPSFTPGTVASQAVNNSASKATFSINAGSTTIGGAFLTTNNTKGGSTGTLVSVEAFTGGDRTLGSGDSAEAQVDYSLADS